MQSEVQAELPSHDAQGAGQNVQPDAVGQSYVELPPTAELDCIVLGAGMSGLSAAQVLQSAGLRFCIIDAAAHAGGRLGGREIVLNDGRRAVFDTSVSLLTADTPTFLKQLNDWAHAALLRRHAPCNIGGQSRQECFSPPRGMHVFAQSIAQHVPLHTSCLIDFVSVDAGVIRFQSSENPQSSFVARNAILTLPPAECSGLVEGVAEFPRDLALRLDQIEHERTLTVLLCIDQPPGGLPEPETDQRRQWSTLLPFGPIREIVDNTAKGISPELRALTIHASSSWSNRFWDSLDEDIIATLSAVAADYIPGRIIHSELIRWDHASTANPIKTDYQILQPAPLIICAGDTFGGTIESAYLSGRAAAELIVNRLANS